MPSRQDGDQQLLDHRILPDNDPANLLPDPATQIYQSGGAQLRRHQHPERALVHWSSGSLALIQSTKSRPVSTSVVGLAGLSGMY